MRVTVWVEQLTNGQYWGRTSSVGGTFVTGCGETVEGLLANIRMTMIAFQEKKGEQEEGWAELDIHSIGFEIIRREQ